MSVEVHFSKHDQFNLCLFLLLSEWFGSGHSIGLFVCSCICGCIEQFSIVATETGSRGIGPVAVGPRTVGPRKCTIQKIYHENRKHNTEPSCLFSQGSPGHNCQGSFQSCMSSLNPALPPETDGFEVTNMHLICMNHSQIVSFSTVVNPISS